MCFEKASRIGNKISFIKIAGVFGRGESTGASFAVRINKRHGAGMELRDASCKDRAKLEIRPKITTFETLPELSL